MAWEPNRASARLTMIFSMAGSAARRSQGERPVAESAGDACGSWVECQLGDAAVRQIAAGHRAARAESGDGRPDDGAVPNEQDPAARRVPQSAAHRAGQPRGHLEIVLAAGEGALVSSGTPVSENLVVDGPRLLVAAAVEVARLDAGRASRRAQPLARPEEGHQASLGKRQVGPDPRPTRREMGVRSQQAEASRSAMASTGSQDRARQDRPHSPRSADSRGDYPGASYSPAVAVQIICAESSRVSRNSKSSAVLRNVSGRFALRGRRRPRPRNRACAASKLRSHAVRTALLRSFDQSWLPEAAHA